MGTKGTTVFEGSDIVTRTYMEDGYSPIPGILLSNEAYGDGLRRFVPVCSDVAIINRKEKTIYLARRRSKPLSDLWWMGGSILARETPVQGAIRCFKRETKIELSPDQLTLRVINTYLWKDRAQEPQDMGCHMAVWCFTVNEEDLPAGALNNLYLDEKEFEPGSLRRFRRDDIVREGAYPAVLDLYDAVFPPHREPVFGKTTLVSDDARRTIWEFNGPTFSVQTFLVKASDLPLGKHAHAGKTEVFTILEGGGELLTFYANPDGPGFTSERTPLTTGSVIEIPPYTAHTFYLDPGSRMHCYSSEPFDETDFIPCPFLTR